METEENNEQKFEVRDLRRKEKFFMDDLYLNGYAKKCGIYATGVYLSLCRHANKEQSCYPSIGKIAEELNISRSQVIRVIKVLKKHNIIRVIRIGKKLNNRYLLLDKSEWSGGDFTSVLQKLHLVSGRNFHSNDTQLRKQNIKEGFCENYKNGDRKYKPFYQGNPMRWVEQRKKWFVISKYGEWLEYVDKESKIEWQ